MTAPTTPKRVLIIENDPGSGPRMLLDWITEAGHLPVIIRAWAGDPLPASIGEHDALIILGGGMLPDEDDRCGWLPAERRLLRDTATDGRTPVLGICLGGQMIAHEFGGRVEANHGIPEKGVVDLRLRPEAAGDPVFGDLPSPFPAIESHQDQITELPPGAVWLAQSQYCNYQLLRLGDRVWAVQFHPEVGADRIDEWQPDALRDLGFDPAQVRAEARRRDPELRTLWRAAILRFLALAG